MVDLLSIITGTRVLNLVVEVNLARADGFDLGTRPGKQVTSPRLPVKPENHVVRTCRVPKLFSNLAVVPSGGTYRCVYTYSSSTTHTKFSM